MVNVYFQTAFIGDLLLSIPALQSLKRLQPDRPLYLICRKGLVSFFVHRKIVDHAIEVDKKNVVSLNLFKKQIQALHVENLICAHESFRSAWMLKDVRAKNRIAYKSWWNALFFNKRINRPMHLPEPLRAMALLSPLDPSLQERLSTWSKDKKFHNTEDKDVFGRWPHAIPADAHMFVEAPMDETRGIQHQLKLQKPYVILAPASQWPTKQWTAKGFEELMDLLAERGLNCYLVGTPNEVDYCHQVIKNLHRNNKHDLRVDVRSIAGQTNLVQLHSVMSGAEVIIANDSGPMHMASVAGRPVVGIFGPTVLSQGYRPWSDQSYVVQKKMDCRPCGAHGHQKCPINTHACMKQISAQDVIRAVDQFVEISAKRK